MKLSLASYGDVVLISQSLVNRLYVPVFIDPLLFFNFNPTHFFEASNSYLSPPLHSASVEKILGSFGRVVATDLSPVALSVAAFNVQKCGLQLSEFIILM
nr:hypothetical protein CFP56_68425 [Quercus suber]